MKSFEDEFDDDLPATAPAQQDPADLWEHRLELVPTRVDYDIEPFLPVDEATDDRKTTESDLRLLNNQLAVLNACIAHVRSVDSLIKLSHAINKTIETRRKVKKLEYGVTAISGSKGRVYEVIE